MRRSLAIMSVAAAAVLMAVLISGGVGRSQAPAPAPPLDLRYSTQMVGVPGVLAPLVAITDHVEQKLYLYSSEKSDLALRMSDFGK